MKEGIPQEEIFCGLEAVFKKFGSQPKVDFIQSLGVTVYSSLTPNCGWEATAFLKNGAGEVRVVGKVGCTTRLETLIKIMPDITREIEAGFSNDDPIIHT